MQNQQPYSERSDDLLVNLAQCGDNPAFAELLERHYGSCLKLAFSILRDRSDAEDEVQNASWKAFEHIAQFQKDAKFSTWLTRIVVNQCLMRLRRTRRAKFVYIDDTGGEEVRPLDLRSQSQSPEAGLGSTEVAAVLQKEIRCIPPLLRKVFVMRDVEQLSMQQVAEELGISIPAAKSRLLRARSELRQRLSRHQGRLGPATLMA